jgi:hypothetical protein
VSGIFATLSQRQQNDLIALYDARSSTVHGGLFDAFSAEDYAALRSAGLIRSYIPCGCMAPLTKLTPKGVKAVRSALTQTPSSVLSGEDK